MRKYLSTGLFVVVLAVVCTLSGLYISQRHAEAFNCNLNAGACGYFTDSFTNADYNVLPYPALIGVGDAGTFISRISNNLYGGSSWGRLGAAYIVDSMLYYKGSSGWPVGGGQGAGLSYAQNNFSTWQNLVNYYAYSSNPGSYGINWTYDPGQYAFCGDGSKLDSGFDQGRSDAAVYRLPAWWDNHWPGGCSWEYTHSRPEVHIYWPGGSFNIGSQCGNLQDSLDRIPSPNTTPSGTISVACNPSNGQETATVNFSDTDGATTGYITTGSWTSGSVGSGVTQITIPISTYNPYASQGVTLYVRDVGPLAPSNSYATFGSATVAPCVTTGCGSLTVSAVPLDPYMTFSLGVSTTNNVNQTPPGASFTLNITPPGGASYTYNGSQGAGGGGSVSSATFSNLGPTNKAGVYAVRWTLTAPGISQTCNASLPVLYTPYLNIYGGDVAVGASPTLNGGASSCNTNANAGVYSWNNHNNGYSGAGAQYAVQALSGIVDFAAAQGSSNTPPTGLSLANSLTPADPSKINLGQGLFGGYYGGTTGDCDFTSSLTSPPTTSDTTIGSTTVGIGVSDVRYVSGADVYISGNVVYAGSGGWASITDIPSFKLIVTGGDIYIDSSVTQLDGSYVAEPSGGSRGRIFTCSSGLRAPISLAVPGSYTTCNKQLVVNGAFVAKSVAFGRTYGSVGQATTGDTVSSNHAAEVFNYTPELWLPRSATVGRAGYTSITGLPPVL